MTEREKPALEPAADIDSAAFWYGLAGRRIELQACAACGRHRFPPMPSCPYCAQSGATAVEVDGRGTVYSWVRVHRALTDAMADEVPYCIVTVDLDGGGRIFGRIDGQPDVAVGDRVAPVFTDHPGWTELRFALAADPGRSGA